MGKSSDIRRFVDDAAERAKGLEPVVNKVNEFADAAASVLNEALDDDFAGIWRKEIVNAVMLLHEVKVGSKIVFENLQGLIRALTMNSTAGKRTKEEMHGLWETFLATVESGVTEEYNAYKERVFSWSTSLTGHIKALLETVIVTDAMERWAELIHLSRSEVGIAAAAAVVGTGGLLGALYGACCLVWAGPAGIAAVAMGSACVPLFAGGIFFSVVGFLIVKTLDKRMKARCGKAQILTAALLKLQKVLVSTTAVAGNFGDTFMKSGNFETDTGKERVQELEDVCKVGGWLRQLEQQELELKEIFQKIPNFD